MKTNTRVQRGLNHCRWTARVATAAVSLLLSGAAHAQAAAPALQASAASQIATLQQIKASRTAIEDKLDTALYMALLRQRGDARLSQLPAYAYLAAGKDGRYAVDIGIAGREDVDAVLRKLGELGAVLVSPKATAYRHQTIRVRIPLGDLMTVAGLKQVTLVAEAVPAATHALNRSEGVEAHAANVARASYGVNGAGQKVCVLSDGVASLAASQASGDLPAVDVLPGQAGSGDEGTAMLEIVHDIAPGAALGFATAFTSEASFADNIRALAASGCTIIVDDIIYFDESPFQDGPVAVAVNDVTAAGVLYFSSAGNEGNKTDGTSGTWEGDFAASVAANPTPLASVGPLHNFGDGGNSLLVTQAASAGAILIWAEHYTLNGGNAATDYDLYVLDGALTSVTGSSLNRQNGAGGNDRAYERVATVPTGSRLVVNRFAAGPTAAPMFNLIAFRGEVDPALSTAGATRGHSAAAAAYSLAATPAAAPFDSSTPQGPFPNAFTAVNTSESFSADGPRRIILTPSGAEITPGNRSTSGGTLRQKPDLTAADGVSTAAPGFNPFYGTSASAPHAAAIAALLKSGAPSLTPAQVRTALTSTAIDIEAAGVDRSTGFGIVMPAPALASVGATPQAVLSAGTAVYTQISGDGDSAIEPNETWSVSIPLSNIGGASAASISGALSASAPTGLTIINGVSAYPALAPNASAVNGTAFRFRVEPSFLCGNPVALVLTASYNGANSPQQFPFAATTGSLGSKQTFRYTGPAVAIPDGGAAGPGANANVNLTVPLAAVIGDVDLSIDGSACNVTSGSTTVGIDHTYDGDLQVRLVAPDGTTVTAISFAGGSGNNFCQTLLDDESAGGSIQTTGAAPFTGSFKPNAPLTAFDGRNAAGSWTLQVQDFASADTGSVRAFSIGITPSVCDATPTLPALSISDVSVSEGNSGTRNASFTVSLSAVATSPVTVSYATANGTATAGSDYLASSGSLTIPAGSSAATVVVTVNGDTVVEADETFVVNLGSPSGATIADGQGQGTIVNDDSASAPALSINDVAITEGNSGTRNITFTVSLTPAATGTVTVTAATANGTASAGSDYTGGSATVSFPAGQTSRTVSLPIRGDTTVEPDETFFVNLSNATGGATIADGQGLGTIVNDDGAPTLGLSISDVSVTEGNSGTRSATFTVTLSATASSPVSVGYATANGTATAGSDYVASSGTVVIAAGASSQTVSVTVNGDTTVEPDETFVVNLSSPSGASIVDGQGQATIVNDDSAPAAPSLSINDVALAEGNSGTRNITFTVTLSAAATTTVNVTAATANGTATAGSDYTGGSLTLSFAPGQTSRTASLPIRGDTAIEPNETFFVNLSNPTGGATIADGQGIGTILNDD